MSSVNTILIPLENGFEEMEAVTPIDLLRRADFEVVVASVSSNQTVKGKNSILITADKTLMDVDLDIMDALVIPGGPAVMNLLRNQNFLDVISYFKNNDKPLAAICAAPLLLKEVGVLENKNYTGHISIAKKMPELIKDQSVVMDGNIITSQGAGTATQFALKLIEMWKGTSSMNKIKDSIHWKD